MTKHHNDPALIEQLAALIRSVDGNHTLGAAALAEALAERGVILVDPQRLLYAAAAENADGTVAPVSNSFSTPEEAAHDLAVLLADDYYLDRRPFLATAIAPTWCPAPIT